jgi:predicted amidohydrolase
MSGQKFKVGMGQLLVEGGEPQRNLKRAVALVEQAAGQGCRVIVLPETLDLAWTHPSAQTEAQPIPGPYSDILCDCARANKIYVCAGLTEQDGDKVYNAAILINDTGDIILKYRKINLLGVCDDYYTIGNMLSVVETPLGVIGVDICSDNYQDCMEIGHVLARMGAQIILSPSSWTSDFSYVEGQDPYGRKWYGPYHHLASLFNMVVIGCTSVGYIVGGPYEGKKMIGCSLVVDRNGLVAQGKYNEFASDLVVAEITVPMRQEHGTAIGEMLTKQGYRLLRP